MTTPERMQQINLNLSEAVRELEIEKLELIDRLKIQEEYMNMFDSQNEHRVWTWTGENDDLPSLVNDRPILIRAWQLRELLDV